MPAPLAFRAAARSLSNSPMSGLGYATLILGDGDAAEECTVRAPVQSSETIEQLDGKDRVAVQHFAFVREDVVTATEAGVIRTSGDRFRDDEGVTWSIRNAFRTGGAMWRLDLIELQEVKVPSRRARPARG